MLNTKDKYRKEISKTINSLTKAAKYNECINYIKSCMAVYPDEYWLHYRLSVVLFFNGDDRNALEQISIAHRIAPVDPFVITQKAEIL